MKSIIIYYYHTYIYIHTYIHVHTYIHIRTYIYIHIHMCTYVRTYINPIYILTLYKFISTYTHKDRQIDRQMDEYIKTCKM